MIWVGLVLSLLPGSLSLEWTSHLPDGAVVNVCVGSDLSLPWNITVGAGESISDVHWFYEGPSREMIAVNALGHFLIMPAFSGRVQHVPETGLVIRHVTTGDSGNYTVEVTGRDKEDTASSVSTFRSSVVVQVSREPPITTAGGLTVTQQQQAVYDVTTGQRHVTLTCGTFTSLGQPSVSVLWTTPSGATIPSTDYANGNFRLHLPNPVHGGSYTCRLRSDSPASACLPEASPLLQNVTVDVDALQARLTLLEAGQMALEAENVHLKSELREQREKANDTQDGLQQLQAENANLTKHLHDLQDKLEAVSRGVSFQARIAIGDDGIALSNGQTLKLTDVLTNEVAAYSPVTGQFTAPVSGTYFFMATVGAHGANSATVWITVDNSHVSFCRTREEELDQGSCNIVQHLTRGQRVELESVGTNSFDYPSTSFTGFLVSPD